MLPLLAETDTVKPIVALTKRGRAKSLVSQNVARPHPEERIESRSVLTGLIFQNNGIRRSDKTTPVSCDRRKV